MNQTILHELAGEFTEDRTSYLNSGLDSKLLEHYSFVDHLSDWLRARNLLHLESQVRALSVLEVRGNG